MAFDFKIPNELARTEAVQAAQVERVGPLRSLARNVTRRGAMAAKAEIGNHALLAMVEECFAADGDGITPNVDRDGRLLIPAPWGRSGYKHWGLRITEARALNWLLRRRCETQSEPLFVYDPDIKRWLLNLAYSRRTALAYLKGYPINLGEWRAAWEATRTTWAAHNAGND